MDKTLSAGPAGPAQRTWREGSLASTLREILRGRCPGKTSAVPAQRIRGHERAVNGRIANALGVFYLALLTIVSVVALPLLFATNHGSG